MLNCIVSSIYFLSLSSELALSVAVNPSLGLKQMPNQKQHLIRPRGRILDSEDWIELDSYKPDDLDGFECAVNEDATVVAYSSPEDDDNQGKVIVRRFDKRTNKFIEFGNIIKGSNTEDYFGSSIALSSSGTNLAVSAPRAYRKQGYVSIFGYDSSTKDWKKIGEDINGKIDGEEAGLDIALSGNGNHVVLGAPRAPQVPGKVRVYQYDGIKWALLGNEIVGQNPLDDFGHSVDILEVGGNLYVGIGAPLDLEGKGTAAVYKLNKLSNKWELLGGAPFVGDEKGTDLGRSVSLANDESDILFAIGFPGPWSDNHSISNTGAKVYRLDPFENWSNYGNLIGPDPSHKYDNTGFKVSLSGNGQRLAISSPDYSSEDFNGFVTVYNFNKDEMKYEQYGDRIHDHEAYDLYGYSLQISKSGEAIVAGTTNNGTMYGHDEIFGEKDCPKGFICDVVNGVTQEEKKNCTILQADVKAEGFGNILDGIYCPENSSKIENCPAGKFCKDPGSDPEECPKHRFCPVKTKEPIIQCQSCKGGETRFAIHKPSLIALVIVSVFLPSAYLIYNWIVKKKSDQEEKEEKWNQAQSTDQKDATVEKEKVAQVERVKPMLEMIEQRLENENILELDKNGNVVNFDIDVLFDAIDADKNGFVSYSELDHAMALTGDQLAIFIRLMNEAAGNELDSSKVSRKVFNERFFNTIDAVGNLTPSKEDAGILFDKIVEHENSVSESQFWTDKIVLERLHKFLAMFLSDKQILTMVRLFRESLEQNKEETNTVGINNGDDIEAQKRSSRNRYSLLKNSAEQDNELLISRTEFISLYPLIIKQVISREEKQYEPFDIQFTNLSLRIKTNGKDLPVVNQVSGRIQMKTMTALMGGSGAGKTSLLNALCGRAYYGSVSGDILINGNNARIEDQLDVIGFVPQDDIVFAELTVLENLMFAGRFKLPRGTPIENIKDLAEEVIADLGLTRVTNSIVGDVNRRGISGGEKKRVNIGLELMAKPSILFLDEPTSGLDASSAVVVMSSLYQLVKNQGMTVCSVIHQPRKQIFELFDSLVLLGVGGRTVYHGAVNKVQEYFENGGYKLPQGESLADWLLDISAGRLTPTLSKSPSIIGSKKMLSEDNFEASNRSRLYKMWSSHFDSLSPEEKESYDAPVAFDLPSRREKPSFFYQTWTQLERCSILFRRNFTYKLQETLIIVLGATAITLLDGTLPLMKNYDPDIPDEYFVLTSLSTSTEPFEKSLPLIFRHAIAGSSEVLNYATKISIVISVLIALSANKELTCKRVEFFRETSSGYDINAYFLAINLFTMLEVTAKMALTGIYCYVMRNTAAIPIAAMIQFVLLGWISSSWGLLWPTFVPLESVPLVTAFHQIFCGLLLSGGSDPVLYKDIYNNAGVGIISGLLASTRFFTESLVVNEYKAMPEQHGFTVNITSPDFQNAFRERNLADNSPSVFEQSNRGWYWGVLPSICVSLTIRFLALIFLHLCKRPQQLKKSIIEEMRSDIKASITYIGFVACFATFLGLGIWSFLEER